jgi:hypothetical protein
MKTEVNLSDHYRKDLINLLTAFSKYSNISFKSITRDDIIEFLESFRKPEAHGIIDLDPSVVKGVDIRVNY